jgi:hypothetical protein
MRKHDEVSEVSRIDGSAVQLEWPGEAETARAATLERLSSLRLGQDRDPGDSLVTVRSREGLRSVDDETAGLVYDSDLDLGMLSAVRTGGRTVRQLTFAARGLVLELEVSHTGRLVGQVVPPQVAEVEVRHRGGTTPLETDELGCFHVPVAPSGPVSFRFQPRGSTTNSVATSWITL